MPCNDGSRRPAKRARRDTTDVNPVLDAFKAASAAAIAAAEALAEQSDALEAKKAAWADMCPVIETQVAAAADFITLHVGGLAFSVPKAALVKHKGSYFHTMLGSGHWRPDGRHTSSISMGQRLTGSSLSFARATTMSRLSDSTIGNDASSKPRSTTLASM
ncbi:Aste57867_794 [Aphanomyces stellatus]|uniref:Aste57867_794 protein n=1 Tax=Aphanomyces stellatus TaxID=120398 RepID=A0A485K6S2_9STRA|nr:hypothetical protein As57867_000793 [Aphanomyces stellatus]VFT78018.1 Aste57867_794 [Aphanomyces stellatus]